VGNSKTIFASQAQSEARDRSPGQSRHLDAERRTLEAMEADTLADELARQLRDSEARYNHLFGHAPVAFQQMDRDGIVRRANQAAGQLLRCRPDQLMGRHAWDFVPPAERESFRVALLGRLATGVETPPFECDYLLEDGSRLTIEVHETIVRNAAGEVTGACRALLDLTERKLAAVAVRQVQRYAAELRAKNEQLANALDAAHNATAAKSRFLAGMSHELRTPLNSIIGFSQLLHDAKIGEVNDEQKDCLSDVLTSAAHLLQLINEILDLSKVEAGKLEFRPKSSSIPVLVDEAIESLRPIAEKKSIRLLCDVPAGLVALLDPVRFKQVLYNYLSNAVKFTPQDGAVSVRIALEDGARFRVEVEDTGVGMAPDELPRLFQEFQQVSSSRLAEQGTGLGLALTRRLVEAQGGTVSVRSTKGVGSVFTATLPLRSPIR
jgi:PAS domain S-box-containing protein